MPYRRLPNTDAARLRAMQTAKQQFDLADGMNMPFNLHAYNGINNFIPKFERAVEEYRFALEGQVAKNQKYQGTVRQARMYISHFIQVLNLACIRKEIQPEKKLLYKLLPDNNAVPDLSTENLLLEWGRNIIDGESARTQQGGLPIYNPPIGKVRVYYDQFKEAYQNKTVAQKNTTRFLDGIQQMRDKADELILDLWNQIEQHFASLGVEEMQERAKDYGVVYYLRRGERKELERYTVAEEEISD
ncbi:MAG: hypothetical protein J5808_01345 [Paludibacteraceae bacterium]|nr:hypothetical protein [Paludibacteraceae bacterium]